MKNTVIKILRGIAIALLGLAVVMTLLGGVGTTCVAWNADKYGKPFAMFVPYKPVYQNLVYLSVAVAMVGGIVTYALLRREKWAYVGALITLVACLGAAGIQMYYTSTLKQVSFFRTPPTNMRFYIAILALLLFLLLKLPGIWNYADFTRPWRGPGSWTAPTGLSMLVAGMATLTTPIWAGPSHMLDGYNLVYVLDAPLLIGGWAMILIGTGLLLATGLRISLRRTQADSLPVSAH